MIVYYIMHVYTIYSYVCVQLIMTTVSWGFPTHNDNLYTLHHFLSISLDEQQSYKQVIYSRCVKISLYKTCIYDVQNSTILSYSLLYVSMW